MWNFLKIPKTTIFLILVLYFCVGIFVYICLNDIDNKFLVTIDKNKSYIKLQTYVKHSLKGLYFLNSLQL